LSLASAIALRDSAELPSRRDEDWRWTDLRGLIRALPEPSAEIAAGDLGEGPFDVLAGAVRVLANGRGSARIVAGADPEIMALRVISRGAGSHAASAVIEVSPGERLTLLETYEGDAGGYVANASLTITVGEGGELERIVLAADGLEGVSVSQAQVTLAPKARFSQTVLSTGARRQRIETRVVHPGGDAEVRMDGVYLLAGKAHADQTTEVVHSGVDGVTRQLVKGVVADQARGVFQGRIVVAEGADRTDARMGHHALVLSDRAEVDAKPELEIYADDVSCAHGNTVGARDDEARFYARQRGIPEAEARAMLTAAFVGEVIDRIGHEGAREIARAWAAERLS
jgi:Fe-S cluster assembly protein SufD